MDLPVFSQIPAFVLNKLGPEANKSVRRKAVKFYEDEDIAEETSTDALSEEVTSSGNGTESQDSLRSSIKSNTIESQTRPVKSALKITKKRKKDLSNDLVADDNKCDAIIQTDLESTKISRSTQTDIVWPFNISSDDALYEDYKAFLQAQSLGHKSNIYHIPKRDGKQPPLKIGLTLPRGKKRKVFYPDDDTG